MVMLPPPFIALYKAGTEFLVVESTVSRPREGGVCPVPGTVAGPHLARDLSTEL